MPVRFAPATAVYVPASSNQKARARPSRADRATRRARPTATSPSPTAVQRCTAYCRFQPPRSLACHAATRPLTAIAPTPIAPVTPTAGLVLVVGPAIRPPTDPVVLPLGPAHRPGRGPDEGNSRRHIGTAPGMRLSGTYVRDG